MWVGCREWGVGGTYRAVVGAEVSIIIFIIIIIVVIIIIIIIFINIVMIIISWWGSARLKGRTG